MINVQVNGESLSIDFFSFSGGERHCKINGWKKPEYHVVNSSSMRNGSVVVNAHVTNTEDLVDLILVKDALDREYMGKGHTYTLALPYIPYARQDRVMVEGEPLSSVVIARIINSCHFDKVLVADPHSDVITSHLKNVLVTHQEYIFKRVMGRVSSEDIIVAPDAGAQKKALKIAKAFKCDLAVGEKIREVSTGNITGTSVHGADVFGKKVIMVDDICDGGMTFIKLGQELKKKGAVQVDLFVTHGIFSRGIDYVFGDAVDNIYCGFAWKKYIDGRNSLGKLKILPETEIFE